VRKGVVQRGRRPLCEEEGSELHIILKSREIKKTGDKTFSTKMVKNKKKKFKRQSVKLGY
jgi:hypothetical protein